MIRYFRALAFLALLGAAPALSQESERTVVIRFFGGVDQATVGELLQVVDEELASGTERFILLISSPGGSVFYGLSAYNYLKGIPAEVITHNFGSTDSIAIMMYCAGSTRRAVPTARFILHGIGLTIRGAGARYEVKALKEKIDQMGMDALNISRVISETTGRSVDEVERLIFDGTVLDPEQARGLGLVQEITDELFPAGSRVISIPRQNNMSQNVNGEEPESDSHDRLMQMGTSQMGAL